MRHNQRGLVAYEDVLCLECGCTYPKPVRGGTTRENPGCPRCGYVGWIAARVRSREERPRDLRRTG